MFIGQVGDPCVKINRLVEIVSTWLTVWTEIRLGNRGSRKTN